MPRSSRSAAAAAGSSEALDKAIHEMADTVVAATTTTEAAAAAGTTTPTPKKKRLCRHPGCTKVIKSQGFCQRHGAKAKRCKIEGCDKQAQGTHDGMCKRHWKSVNFPEAQAKPEEQPPPPEGQSVYDSILPMSISYRPSSMGKSDEVAAVLASGLDADATPPEGVALMPLVAFLREGSTNEAGWHRNAERRARGLFPVTSLSSQLEPWERQLALVEVLLLSGGTPYANFKDLAHGWGREKGFHNLLATSVCERRGEVERKKRSDYGQSGSSRKKKAKKTGDVGEPTEELKMASVEDMVDVDKKAAPMEEV